MSYSNNNPQVINKLGFSGRLLFSFFFKLAQNLQNRSEVHTSTEASYPFTICSLVNSDQSQHVLKAELH